MHDRLRRTFPGPLRTTLLVLALALAVPPAGAHAQSGDMLKADLLAQFETSMGKFISLARAMPAESYVWSPGAGVMEVGQVFMHVARYNYLYPSGSLGVAAPAGVDLGAMEGERERERVVRALEQSQAYVRSALQGMSAADLSRPTPLYGRQTDGWGVMLQLVAHMNEHLGQSIAYARMNGVVPPWSR
jgi:uncharacterized damage-inducible protein DinB